MTRDAGPVIGFFLASFVVTGLTVSVTPSRADGDAAWLGGVLLIGTMSSILGVALAERWHPPRWVLPGLTAATTLACLLAPSAAGHAVWHVAARGLANAASHDLDRRARLGGRDWLVPAARTAGMTAAPLWFSAVADAHPATLVAVATLGAAAALGAPTGSVAPSLAAAPDHRDAPLWLGATLGWAALHVLASGAVAVLGRRADAGLTVGVVFASAALALPVLGGCWRSPPLVSAATAPVAALAAAAALVAGPVGAGARLGGAAIVGVAFAVYLLALRAYAHGERDAGRPGAITAFNQLGNASALVGFGALALSGAAPAATGVPVAAGVLAALGATITVGASLRAGHRANPRWTNVVPHPSS